MVDTSLQRPLLLLMGIVWFAISVATLPLVLVGMIVDQQSSAFALAQLVFVINPAVLFIVSIGCFYVSWSAGKHKANGTDDKDLPDFLCSPSRSNLKYLILVVFPIAWVCMAAFLWRYVP